MSEATRRFAGGALWLYGYRWGERLLDFVSIVVLARLLAPEDFGLVAIAASFVAIVEGMAAFDVNKALIRTRNEDRDLYDTAWTLSALRGVLSALIMVAVTPFLSDVRISEVVLVLALTPLLGGLANPRFVLFERDLIYSKLAILTLGAKIASFAVTLTLAVLYQSYWALVAGALVGACLSMLLSYLLKPYRPRFTLVRHRDIFAFSGWLSLTTMVTTLAMETDKIIVGRLLGVVDAGLYFMTQRIGVLPTREMISPLQRILFPSFSELTNDPERLRRVVRESVNVLGSLSLPAGCGFALIAEEFVPLVLGEQWTAIIPLLVVLVPYLGLRATLSMTLPCVMALGQTRLLFQVSLVYALFHVPIFVAGTAFFGLQGTIWSLVAAGIFYSFLNAWMLRKTLGITLPEIIQQLVRPLTATLAMVLAVSGFAAWIVVPFIVLSLALKILLGALVFCAVQSSLWHLAGRPAGIEQRLLQLLRR